MQFLRLGSQNPFAYREFTFFWFARLLSTIAQNAMVIVIGWQVYDIARLTMSPGEAAFQLGLVGLAQFLPLVSLVLVTGWVADLIDRRRIVQACNWLQMICGGFLGYWTLSDGITLNLIFLVAVLLGVARAFSMPASAALGPNLVPHEVLPRAIATSMIAGRIGAVSGPAAGGMLYAVAAAGPYLASAAMVALAGLLGFFINRREASSKAGRSRPWRQMSEGLIYVFRHKLILGAISLDLVAVLLGGATALMPIFAREILHVGPEGLGLLRAAPAVGAFGAAIWFALRPLRHNVGPKMLAAVAVFGTATATFGLSKSMILSMVCLVTLGAADMLSVHVRHSLIQLSTPDGMRGRVGAVASLFISGSNELGEAESGFLAAAIGPVAAVTFGGIAAMVAAGLWAKWFPALANAKYFDQIPAD